MRKAYQGCRLIWAAIPKGRRPLIKSIFIMWAQISWIAALSTWNQVEHSRRSQLGFAIGAGLSTIAVSIYGLWLIRVSQKALQHAEQSK